MASTRVFIGELVDTACEVRKEWQAASKTLPTGEEVSDNESIRHRTADENQGPLTPDHDFPVGNKYPLVPSGIYFNIILYLSKYSLIFS